MNDVLTYGIAALRAIEPADIDILYEWENDSSLWEVSNSRTPFSRHLLEKYIRDANRDIYEQKQFRFLIQSTDGQPKGTVDLFDFDPYHQRAGVGIMIHKTSDRRMGYASDALLALENYCLNILGIRQLYANISEENEASIRLFEKTGYQVTGIKKKWLRTPMGWKDEWLFQKFLIHPNQTST
jgi:diamine N-acetyltransferase